jgi:hypothetical protein
MTRASIFDHIDGRLYACTRRYWLWYAPIFWGFAALVWAVESPWSMRQHWSTLVLIYPFALFAVLLTLYPPVIAQIVFIAVLLPAVALYALARFVAKVLNGKAEH